MVRSEPYPKLSKPVFVPAIDTHVVVATLDQEQGKREIEQAVRGSVLRPFDIARASIEEPRPLWVPFWRVALTVDGFHFGLSQLKVGVEDRTVPVPTGGARSKEAVVMVCARTLFPYEPKLPSFLTRAGGTPPLEVAKEEIGALADTISLNDHGAEVIESDVDRGSAEAIASGMRVRDVRPTNALYARYEPKIESATFVLYPVYFARYDYEGEARRHAGERLFVAVSGKNGKVISATYPSAVRAVAAKVRRLLSFDRRL